MNTAPKLGFITRYNFSDGFFVIENEARLLNCRRWRAKRGPSNWTLRSLSPDHINTGWHSC